mmetsp:Transcript_37676/g.93666  ORF Transcript_37676/g.93666 Transcript_37676/m.93666 type:complete len:213 (+) Transcript_37676:123-761(+)
MHMDTHSRTYLSGGHGSWNTLRRRLLLLLGLQLFVHGLVGDGRRALPLGHVPAPAALPVHRARAHHAERLVEHPETRRRQHAIHHRGNALALGVPFETVPFLYLDVLHAYIKRIVHQRQHGVSVRHARRAVTSQITHAHDGVRPRHVVARRRRGADCLLRIPPPVQRRTPGLRHAADDASAQHQLPIHQLPRLHIPSLDADVAQHHHALQLG